MGRTVHRLARRPRSSPSRSRQPIRTSPRRVLRRPPWRSCVFTSVRPPLASFIQFHDTKLKTQQNTDPQPALPHLVAVETALTFNVSYRASLVLDTAVADDDGEGGGLSGGRMETFLRAMQDVSWFSVSLFLSLFRDFFLETYQSFIQFNCAVQTPPTSPTLSSPAHVVAHTLPRRYPRPASHSQFHIPTRAGCPQE